MSHLHLLWDVLKFWSHAWGAVMRPLLEDLGILSIAFAFVAFVVRYGELRWGKKTHNDAIRESVQYFKDNVWTPLKALVALYILGSVFLGPYQIHEQDLKKTMDRDELAAKVKNLENQLQFAQNNLDVSSPAANNAMYMMQAFRGYRGMIGGFKPVSCQIRLTAPPESNQIAMTVSAFSIQVTNCATFGPFDMNNSPDEERDTITGMVAGSIVFHSRRNDKAAFALYDNLSNLLPLKRSYDVPAGSPDHYIWLQFGPGVKWNGQRFMRPARSP